MVVRLITQRDKENAQRLRNIWDTKRKTLGLTQSKAAAKLGLKHQSTVSQYINCDIAMNTEVILKFAKLLEVDPARIDPGIRSLLVRDLLPPQRSIDVLCSLELSDIGNYCVANKSNYTSMPNPFQGDVPNGTAVIGVEVETEAYKASIGIPHNSMAYILKDAEPDINDTVFVEHGDVSGFYQFSGLMESELLLIDPLTAASERVSMSNVSVFGVVVGHLALGLEKKNQWAL